MSNPTPPANSSVEFLAGWNARAAADGTAPAPVPTPAPTPTPAKPAPTPAPTSAPAPSAANVVSVALGAALASVFLTAKAGQVLQLAKGTYTIDAPVTIAANNVTVKADPAGTTIVRKSIAGSTTGIMVSGNNVEIAGITFDSDKPLATAGKGKVSVNAMRVSGQNVYIHNCTGRNIDDLVFLEQTASGARIIDITTTDELRADAIYVESTSNVTITGATIPGSTNEHGIRLDTVDNKTAPQNITITDCTIGNADGKESIAIRWGWNVTVTGCTLNAWTRANQGPATPPAPNTCCKNITYTNNTLGPGAYITINPYTDGATIHGNTFHLDAEHVGIELQGPSVTADIAGSVKTPTAAGIKLKPLIHSYGAVTVTGTDAGDIAKS